MHYADLVQLQFQVQYKVHTTQLSTVNDSAVNESDTDFRGPEICIPYLEFM